MEENKYLSYDGLVEYTDLVKKEIDNAYNLSFKDSKDYTDTEITKITNGTVTVKKAEHSSVADSATVANKLNSVDVGSVNQPIYLEDGVATKVTVVGTSYGGTGATTVAGARSNLDVYSTTEVDQKLSTKSDSTHNHDSKYDTKGAADAVLNSSKSYTDDKIAAIVGEGASETLNTIGEISAAIEGLNSTIRNKVDKVSGKGLSTNDLTAALKNNYDAAYTHSQSDHAPSNAEANQNAFSKIRVLSSSTSTFAGAPSEDTGDGSQIYEVNANAKQDTIGFNGGDLINLDVTNSGTTYEQITVNVDVDQLDAVISDAISTKADIPHTHPVSDVTNLQSSLDAKQETITGGATTITSSNLTTNRALISNASGKVAVSSTTSTELGYLHGVTSAIQPQIDGKSESGHTHIYYGECSTASDTVAKTVTVPDFKLETGAMVIVKFTNSNSASSPTLNVSNTGAKPIYRYGTTVVSTGTTTTGWTAGAVQIFIYDGTGWIRDYWNNTTYSNASLGCGYATCSTAASTKAKVGTLSSYSLTTGGIVSVKFTYDVPASATLNINSKGAKNIYHRGSAITAGVIKAGDVATFVYSSQYHLISIDRWHNDISTLQTGLDEKVPTFRTVNGKELSSNITLSAGDVGAYTKSETDNAVAQKTQVQIITWGADD